MSEDEREYHRTAAREHFRRLTPNQRADRALFANYGIRLDDKRRLYDLQKGCCTVCGVKFTSVRAAHVDHDHASRLPRDRRAEAVRGLLCYKCNNGLGSFGDKIENLVSAINYLKKHRGAK